MVGTNEQIAALVCHLNARLRGFPPTPFFANSSTCRFCAEVSFYAKKRSSIWRDAHWREVASTPDEWLELQLQEDAERALLIQIDAPEQTFPAHVAAAFANARNPWLIGVERAGRFDAWTPVWEVGDRTAPDRRIWRVQYFLFGERVELPAPPGLESNVAPRLIATLTEIEAFARRHRLDNFADCFANALTGLSATDAVSAEVPIDLAPPGVIPPDAARLLNAAQRAWVFGGMGSWNDQGFDGAEQQEYERLSASLHQLISAAIAAGVNASAPARE